MEFGLLIISFGAVNLEDVKTERSEDAGDLERGTEKKAGDLSISKYNVGERTADSQEDKDDDEVERREC